MIINDSVTREAITEKQQADYLGFIKLDKTYSKYYEAIFILFNTGLRISEFCGLTVSDIDFEKNRIKVDHQLIRASNMQYILQAPKTEKGIRYIPMTVEVADCFRRIISRRKRVRTEPVIGGRVGFLFLDKNSKPTVAQHWEKYMQRIREKYNNDIGRLPLPVITPHICRHTFCTNMAKNGFIVVIIHKKHWYSSIYGRTFFHSFSTLAMKNMRKHEKICRIIRKYSLLFMLCQNELWGYFTKIIKYLRRFEKMYKIMFVCHGNICRSPMAEFIMKKLAAENGLSDEIYITSCATSTEELGNSVYPPAKAELARHGIGCAGKTAVQLKKSDYDKYDLFVGMDTANIRNMMRIFGSDKDGKVYKLLTFAGRGDDVSDPWYSRDFGKAYSDIDEGCQGLLRHLRKELL